MQHHFDMSIATKYGVNVAIFLNNLAFWIHLNKAHKKHFYDGRYWTYNTQEAFTELFPYWSRQNLRTIIKSCIDHHLIMMGNFNETSYDRTSWYALTDLGLSLFSCFNNTQLIPVDNSIPLVNSNQRRGLDPSNPLVEINQPIPDSKPDNKTDREQLPVDNFTADEANQELARRYDLDINEELRTFREKHRGKKTQEEFTNWLKYGLEYKNKKKPKQNEEVKSTVPEYGPGHPTWELNQEWKRKYPKKEEMKEEKPSIPPKEVLRRYKEQQAKLKGLSNDGHQRRDEKGSKTGSDSVRKAESYLLQRSALG